MFRRVIPKPIIRTLILLLAVSVSCGPSIDPEAEMEAAGAAVGRRDYDTALEILQKIVDAYPEYGDVRYFCGLVLRRSGRTDAARLQFLVASRIDSTHAGALTQLGMMAYEAGDEQEAMGFLERAVALGVSNLRVHDKLAYLYRRYEKTEKARQQLEAADRQAAGDPRYRIKIGLLEKARGNLKGAEAVLRPIATAYPNNIDAQLFLAETLKDLNRLAGADSVLAGARRLNPRHARIQYLLGGVRLGLGMADSAEVAFRKAAQLTPDLLEARYGLAQALIRQGRRDEAEEVLDSFQAAHEENMADEEKGKVYVTHWRQSLAYEKQGKVTEAVASLRKAREVFPGDALALTLLWRLYEEAGMAEEAEAARKETERALGSFSAADAYRHLGIELMRRSEPAKAAEVLEAAVAEAPTDALSRYHLIRAYEAERNLDQARIQAERALKLVPDR